MKLAGIVGVVMSVWTLADERIMSRLIGHRIFLITLLLVGLVGALTSLLGIISLVRKRRLYLKIYASLCLLFLSIIFVTAVSSFWIVEEILKNIQADMVAAMKNYDSSPSYRRSWDSTHRYLKCCGIKSPKDWANYHISIPKSCCAKAIDQCIIMTEAVAFKVGCLRNAALLLKSHVHAISITALLIFIILVMNFSFALCILCRLKERRSNR
ncbi:CD151 antigen [Augochlora pura]